MSLLARQCLAAAAVSIASAACAFAAEAFPERAVRIVVPAAPGGYADVAARQVAQKMSQHLGQPVVVENRAGGDTLLSTRFVKDAPADGYTVLLQSVGFTVSPAIRSDLGYDPVRDFVGVGPIHRFASAMVVASNSPDKDLAAFLARARKPGAQLSYASGGTGTPSHLATASFLQAAGLDLLHIPYKGVAATLPDVMSGRVDFVFEAVPTALSRIKSGGSKVLGVSAGTRLEALPNTPTFVEQGLSSFSSYAWHGLLVRSSTPKPVVDRLAQALRFAVTSSEVSAKFRDEGAEPMLMSPDEFTDFLKRDVARMAKLVAELGLNKQ